MSNRIVGRIRAEIEALAQRMGGIITPDALVTYARDNPLSALHRCFDWDDAKAGQRWRLEQAAGLVRRYCIRVEGDDGEVIRIRGFVSLPSDRRENPGTYRLTTRVMTEADQVAEMVETAKMELHAFRLKYAALQQVAGMGEVFDAIAAALGG